MTLTEHLSRLHRLAEGGLRAVDRREREPPPPKREGVTHQPPAVSRAFWDGYRQAIEDIEDFAQKEGLCG